MSRRSRILLAVSGTIVGLAIIAVIALLVILRTDRFRAFVKEKVIAAIDTSTGGRAEIGSFIFDPQRLHAHIETLVIHGKEPPGAAPFLSIKAIDLQIKLFTGWKHLIGLESLTVDQPVANVIVLENGETNIPSPETAKEPSDQSALETVVNLAVRHFDIEDGLAQLSGRKTQFSGRGENLLVGLRWNLLAQRYEGEVSINPLTITPPGGSTLSCALNLPVQIEKDRIRIDSATILTAGSQIHLTGTVEDMKNPVTSFTLMGTASIQEIANFAGGDLQKSLAGSIQLNARGRIVSADNYSGNAEIMSSDLSFIEQGKRFEHVQLTAAVDADPREVALKTLRLGMLGGEIEGNGMLRSFDQFTTSMNLRNFDVQTLARIFGGTRVSYAGAVSGNLAANGSLKASGTSGINAQATLAIAPKRSGIPVSGRIVAAYNGANGSIPLRELTISLPNSRIEAHGVLGQQIELRATSRNLNDFPLSSSFPVTLNGGTATLTAQVRGALSAPQIAGKLSVAQFAVSRRKFDQLMASFTASSSNVTVQSGQLSRGPLRAQFSGALGLRNWSVTKSNPITVAAAMQNGDVADLLALAGESAIPASGKLTVQANISGTIANPQGSADISVIRGTLYQEPFDSLQASARFSDQLIQIPMLQLTAGPSVVNANATYTHPRDSLSAGAVQVHLTSNDVGLAQIRHLQNLHPGMAGILRLNADASGNLDSPPQGTEFTLTALTADIHATGLRDSRESYGDLNASARSNGSVVDFRADSNFAGSTLQATGQTRLTRDYPTTARLMLTGLPIEKALSVAGSPVPARGTLSANADLSGTKENLHSDLTFQLVNGALYQEPFNRMEGSVAYAPDSISISRLSLNAPAGSLDLNGTFTHPTNSFDSGQIAVHVNSSSIDLARVTKLQAARPGLAGAARVTADVAGSITAHQGQREILLTKGEATGSVSALAVNRRPLGNATFRANTAGQRVAFSLRSDLGQSDIQADGQVTLSDEYPIAAKLTFKNLTYAGFKDLIPSSSSFPQIDLLAEGEADVNGSIRNTANLKANLQLTRLELSTSTAAISSGAAPKTIALRNDGPLVATLDRQQVRIQRARLTGQSVELSFSGTAPLDNTKPISLTVNGNVDLALLQSFNSDLYSSGQVSLNATAGGTISDPRITGQVELKNASLSIVDLPNGISQANGVILLSGTSARVQSLTAKIGGGDASITGSFGFAGANQNYNLQVKGNKIRTRYQGASVITDLNLAFEGSNRRSTLSGDVVIQQVTYAPESDVGSMLYKVSSPPRPASTSPFLSNLRLNVRIRTATGAIFRTTLAQTIAAAADLRLRGTAQSPGMTGRIDITEGTLVFFGNQYTVDEGNVSFYNGSQIEPVLALSFETKAQGVTVNMRVSGPMNDLKLSYTSDPPLRFEEIVALLGTGKAPSDPTIAAHQPSPPDQTVAQLGESALIEQTVANPVANRLQRVFGVSQLKIDPTFTTGSTLPQARLTLQQQVTPEITFTYSQDLTQANSQLIRVEWAFSSRFSVVASRDETGIVGLDFFYKKQFR